ncbi:alpha/beta hydrolase [Sphingomicrobium aestuariivivum]|nr:esterase family protein [Sphingomicrobium aestuariivivum]
MMMKKRIATVIVGASMALAPAAPAQGQDGAKDIGEIVEIAVPAPSLEGNLLGTPTTQAVNVYLPPSYDSEPDRRYPVLYLLHGFHGTDQTWLKPLDAAERPANLDSPYKAAGLITAEWIAAKFEHDAIPEMILVAPNGRNAFKHSFWMNSEVTGNWTDYVVKDVVGHVDAHYRTLPQRESRGLAGHSGGGHGSIRIAMLHPDMFNAVYAMAPCCLGPDEKSHTTVMELDEGGRITGLSEQIYTTVEGLGSADDLPGSSGFRPHDFNVNVEAAMGAVYSPNPANAPFYSDFIFDRVDGALVVDRSVMERRRARFAYHVLDTHAEALRSLGGLFIDTGELEFKGLREGAGAFAAKLSEKQVPVRFEVYADGDHGNLFVPRMMTLGLDFFTAHLATEMVASDGELSSSE